MHRHLLLVYSLGIMSHLNITSTLLIFALYQNITSPIALGIALSMKRVMRIILDIPTGILADIMGFKSVFFLGSILHLLALCLLLWPDNRVCLVLHLVCLGASASCSEGKIEACAYNICDRANKIGVFAKYLSTYYFVIDALRGIAAFSLIRFKLNNIMVYLAMLIVAIAIVIIYYIDDAVVSTKVARSQKLPVRFLWMEIKKLYRTFHMLPHIICLWALCNFLGWQISSIASMSALAHNPVIAAVAEVKTYEALFMSLGCILSFFLNRMLSSLRNIVILLTSLIAFILMTSLCCSGLLFFSMLTYIIFYASLEIALERVIEKHAPFYLRATLTSIATCSTFIVSVILMTLHTVMTNHPLFGYRMSLVVIFAVFFLYLLLMSWRGIDRDI